MWSVCADTAFQFHSGSIKRKACRLEQKMRDGFNSIVVRLKGDKIHAPNSPVTQFQFHSGSIKSMATSVSWLSCMMFQFHSGSIKSG